MARLIQYGLHGNNEQGQKSLLNRPKSTKVSASARSDTAMYLCDSLTKEWPSKGSLFDASKAAFQKLQSLHPKHLFVQRKKIHVHLQHMRPAMPACLP